RLRETLWRANAPRIAQAATRDRGPAGDDVAQRALGRARTAADALEVAKAELHAAVDGLDALIAERLGLPEETRETIGRCRARLEDLKQKITAATEDALGARMAAECELVATTVQRMPAAVLKRDFDLLVVSLALTA